jgi:hypothetical protein
LPPARAVSDCSAPVADAVVPFAPKSNASGDQLDRAGKAILGLLNRAASAAEANYQQAVEMANKLSAQVRTAEGRMRELEAKVRYHEDKADRAEKWLYQISVEIEQKFFGRASQPLHHKQFPGRSNRLFISRRSPAFAGSDAGRPS